MLRFHADPELIIAEAGDEARPARIAGIAVPWAPVSARVSDGTVVSFERGAFDPSQRPAKLVENHDLTQLRGTVTISDGAEGLEFEATFADTAAARDAVALVKAGAYDSVSVGAVPEKWRYDGDVMVVEAAKLVELSLVAVPAFAGAVITEIAATAEVADETPAKNPEEETMSENPTPEVVEAAASAVVPTAPIYASAKREFVLPSASEYLSKFLQGGAVWSEFQQALKAAAPNVITSDLDGVLPTPIVAPVYNGLIGRRPVIDAIGTRAMPQGGKVFIRPSVTTHTTMGLSNGENAALDQGTLVINDNQVTKAVYGGYVKLSEEAMDWSQPEVLSVLLDDMARVYAKQTETVVETALQSGIVAEEPLANATVVGDWLGFVWNASKTILDNSSHLPTHLFLSPDYWAALGKLEDDAGRPLFPQVGPMNAFGNLGVGTLAGNAFGLSVVVCPHIASNFVAVGNADGFEIFEQQKGAISAEANDGSLSRTIAFRGYLATLMIDADKFVKLEL
jgi:HK97 family phage prohead protease